MPAILPHRSPAVATYPGGPPRATASTACTETSYGENEVIHQVAREVATLDRLSAGRVTLGVGIGDDGAGELSATGEQLDPRVRGQMLDESLQVLAAAWSGERVHHRGTHYVLDGLALRPAPAQLPHPPVWVAARYGNPAPMRRAARHDGVFPIGLDDADQLREVRTAIDAARDPGAGAFDVAVGGRPGGDPRPYEATGATWWMVSFSPYDVSVRAVDAVARGGPPR